MRYGASEVLGREALHLTVIILAVNKTISCILGRMNALK